MNLTIRRDVRTIQWLDELGYDEVFIGEHHSGGWEPISSPEIFIAHVAQETESIKLGTGVLSLGYHHPYMNRRAHPPSRPAHPRGRVMLGLGPGATAPDTPQLGLHPTQLRPRLDEGLGVILRLLKGEEVTHESPGWFALKNASCQLQPYHEDGIPVFVTATSSPGSARVCRKARRRHPLRRVVQVPRPGLKSIWETASDAAAEHGHTLDRRDYRVMTRIYVAESREQACRDISVGLHEFDFEYFSGTLGRPAPSYEGPPEGYADWCVDNGGALFGTPEEVTEGLKRVWESSDGGFGGILLMGNEFAPPERMRNHYELLARYVMPHFNGAYERPARSHARAVNERVANNQGEAEAIAEAIRAAGGQVPDEILGAPIKK